MTLRLLPVFLLALTVLPAQAQPDVDPIVEAERAFAADVASMGVRDGTLRHLMAESVVFRPLPVAARGWYAAQDTPDFLLQWQPWFAEIAASGDFGWSIGPWRSSTLEEGLRPDGHGFYATIWMKDGDGDWKVLVDHGVGVPEAPADRENVMALGEDRSAAIEGSFLVNTRYQGLMAAALRLPSAQRPGGVEVERAWLDEDLVVLRPGRAPIQGHDAVRQIVIGDVGASPPDLTVMAASGDLGVSLGGEPEQGAYLRVWRHRDEGGWLLAAEVAVPVTLPPAVEPDADADADADTDADADADADADTGTAASTSPAQAAADEVQVAMAQARDGAAASVAR